jgi:1,4-alpha-glucan branching enzyme
VALAVLAAAALLALSGCSSLSFIKRRLPPPALTGQGVVFQFEAPSARIVQLMGSWPENNWGAGQAQTGSFRVGEMRRGEDGIWRRTEKLPPGRYRYKFKVDDVNWKEDPNNPERVEDGFGGFNSLLDVK